MPVKVPENLPSKKYLEQENVFIMDEFRADSQDIRPLKFAVLNLMPDKETAEKQLLRMIANTPLQIEVCFLNTGTYKSKHAPEGHLKAFYRTFGDVLKSKDKFDALIITGAPVEQMEFSSVAYWDELKEILDWANGNVYSSLYICWAAQAALYYHYGINKFEAKEKISGLFTHNVLDKKNPLTMGFDDFFTAPHSRYTEVDKSALLSCPDINILAESKEAGIYMAAAKDLRRVFVFGHGEYDTDTLHKEYMRDIERGLNVSPPKNYYVNGVIGALPPISWRAHHSLFFSNFINYCVYQKTPFDIKAIKQ